MVQPHPDFARILAAVGAARRGPVLVLGAVDTGKTTLVRHLASLLAAKEHVWVVCGDTGQAWIGPPTTMARARLARPRRRWERLRPDRIAFTGATSPGRCLARSADLVVQLAREGLPAGARVVLDTPGLVAGPLAETLWRRVAEGLRPALVIAVEYGSELAPIIRPFRTRGALVVIVAPDPRARVRHRAERTGYRQKAYRRYFRGARLRTIRRSRVRIVSAVPGVRAVLSLGRLIALRDAAGRDVALGVVRSIGASRVGVTTPFAATTSVAALATGLVCLNPRTWQELAP
jgi:polynucleotide 5'-kinase involved in rRNA processing